MSLSKGKATARKREKQLGKKQKDKLVFCKKMVGFLLLCLVLVEAGISVVLIYERPSLLYSTLLWAIQSFNQGGPVLHKGFAGSLALALTPTLFRIFRVRRRIAHAGLPAASTDHLTLQTHVLEASLIGLAFYLFMIMCHLHARVFGIALLRKELETLRREAAAETSLESSALLRHGGVLSKEEEMYRQKIDMLESMILSLRNKLEDMQMESDRKDVEIRAAEANSRALQKQSEGFLLEYDRLLEDNQALRAQLSSIILLSGSNKKS